MGKTKTRACYQPLVDYYGRVLEYLLPVYADLGSTAVNK